MRMLSRRWSLLGIVLVFALESSVCADVLDPTLHRLVPSPPPGSPPDPDVPSARADYRQLHSELGVILAPSILTPADTLGWSGFQIDASTSFTTLSNSVCRQNAADPASLDGNQCPWQRGVEGRDGAPNRGIPRWAQTISVMARKGIWLPVPSFEIGVGGTGLLQSNLYALQAYAKIGLHEGFHRWGVPSIAVRASGAHVFGSADLGLTMVQVDAELSKSFGVRGSVNLTPYLGAAALVIFPQGQVLDTTPNVDDYSGGPGSPDIFNNVAFADQPPILRWRFFGGLRLRYSVLVVTTEFLFTACGDLGLGVCYQAPLSRIIPDRSPHQYTINASAGFAF